MTSYAKGNTFDVVKIRIVPGLPAVEYHEVRGPLTYNFLLESYIQCIRGDQQPMEVWVSSETFDEVCDLLRQSLPNLRTEKRFMSAAVTIADIPSGLIFMWNPEFPSPKWGNVLVILEVTK